MRFVDRNGIDEPPSLKDPSDAVQAEMDAAKSYYHTYNPRAPKAKGYDFKQYKGVDVTFRLRALFNNKCAYCESDVGDNLEVEHFRPKGGVTEDPSHTGYWWLAHSWTNLLPSCIPCNQKRRQHLVTEEMTIEELTALMATRAKLSYGKANHFPIEGVRTTDSLGKLEDEKPLLIDPTIDDPESYLKWSRKGHYSVVQAKPTDMAGCTRALSTINIFALNRANLVQSRTRILTQLRFQAERILEDLEEDMVDGGSPHHLTRAIKRVDDLRHLHGPDQPYSSMVKAFVDEFAMELRLRISG